MAFLGDAFYELSVRSMLVGKGRAYNADRLHMAAVKYVKAQAQARAVRGMTADGLLSEEELDVIRRARNHKPKSYPKNADPVDYKLATAFEALLGWNFVAGRKERAEELAALAIRVIDGERA